MPRKRRYDSIPRPHPPLATPARRGEPASADAAAPYVSVSRVFDEDGHAWELPAEGQTLDEYLNRCNPCLAPEHAAVLLATTPRVIKESKDFASARVSFGPKNLRICSRSLARLVTAGRREPHTRAQLLGCLAGTEGGQPRDVDWTPRLLQRRLQLSSLAFNALPEISDWSPRGVLAWLDVVTSEARSAEEGSSDGR